MTEPTPLVWEQLELPLEWDDEPDVARSAESA